MIPYVIINGKSSKNIKGLIVSSLPPITKPPVRVEYSEIDGRSGDKATILGYGAYDKAFTIGLHGEYDIDDIISFFNQDGIITFSNELDKYYEFATYNQINFERLVRYRTAQVTIHVQPFKYPAEEQPVIYHGASGRSILLSKVIKNTGNEESLPVYEITGSGDVNLYIDGLQKLKISLPQTTTKIVIDTDSMNAYLDSIESDTYLNRICTGDYSELRLKAGSTTLTVTGIVEDIKISNLSRWV